MKSVLPFLLLSLLLFQGGHRSLAVTSSSARPSQTEKNKELSCELSLRSEVHAVDGYFDANLLMTNISDHLVRICTLTQEWRTVGRTDYRVVLRPDFWKSDSPRPQEFPRHIVSIEPGQSISLPLKFRYYDELQRLRPLTISVGYETLPAFANRYGTWAGSVQSKPVTVNVVERGINDLLKPLTGRPLQRDERVSSTRRERPAATKL